MLSCYTRSRHPLCSRATEKSWTPPLRFTARRHSCHVGHGYISTSLHAITIAFCSVCVEQIAHALIHRTDIYPPALVQRRTSAHLKSMIGESYMRCVSFKRYYARAQYLVWSLCIRTLGTISDDYMSAGREIAFRLSKVDLLLHRYLLSVD